MRGSLPEGTSLSRPATFIAGLYDLEPGGEAVPALVTAPDWTALRLALDGQGLSVERGEVLEHRRILDLRQGLLWREWRHRDAEGRVVHEYRVRVEWMPAPRRALDLDHCLAMVNYRRLGRVLRIAAGPAHELAARTLAGDGERG